MRTAAHTKFPHIKSTRHRRLRGLGFGRCIGAVFVLVDTPNPRSQEQRRAKPAASDLINKRLQYAVIAGRYTHSTGGVNVSADTKLQASVVNDILKVDNADGDGVHLHTDGQQQIAIE